MAKLVVGGVRLRKQIDQRWPNRDRRSDGWIGDKAHSKRRSQHNPDKNGWVRAIDIDADLNKSKTESWHLAETIKAKAVKGDKRISYIIHQGRICSSRLNWKWRVYLGSNPHHTHIHISFTSKGDTNGRAFGI